MITILADDHIPFVTELFGGYGKLLLKRGNNIQKTDLNTVNVLLTRSITQVNAALLKGTPIEFVGSTTAGFDHIDSEWLTKQLISWSYAPGANAVAVAEYVLHCIAFLRKKSLLPQRSINAAVVGVGHLGKIVSNRLQKIGFSVFHNDPPRAISENKFISIPLESLTEMDLICIHTPLTNTGNFPTYHLIDDALLKRLKPGCVLLNAGRGAVVNNQALLKQQHIVSCLDVWENEPDVNLALLEKVAIATPHIAGYSKEAKLRASLMIYKDFLNHFQLIDIHHFKKLRQLPEKITIDIRDCHPTIEDVLLKIYDPNRETEIMRKLLINNKDHFENLRRCYPLRPEFSTIEFTPSPPPKLKKILQQWGFTFDFN
ncbi:Erythronate-4-phosphate dehydrogenase [Coxiella-like endosymbiont]|uniref:4-phosphoerythronate dehydrogenase n=1 Tax=Coxiella endosymbiont of Rhipicephalus microplus TaxID=1656186 RepID=UPI000C808542|nr:4-phosphoerythronate dehydrogenase [Coxiella endosymbiont of Rhipicephalus microplus]PMB54446.1 Erythronate-4-phosphate dehydrogenase [Coxiella-like endosymbiont]